jgi:amino acid transporter
MSKIPQAKSTSTKKLGFISCVVAVIGSCIGAGIFFKNQSILTNTGGNLILAIVC